MSTVANAETTASVDASGTGALLRAERLSKLFQSGSQKVMPLDGIDLEIERGAMVAIVGPSGAGKSTLLHILGSLDTPTSGEVYFAGNSLRSFSERGLSEYRNRTVGFVWQRHHLMPDFTAIENAAMPLFVRGESPATAFREAKSLLEEVGLGDCGERKAGQLSGGEQQRVAIARALANRPQLLLADEPTGDLDEGNAEVIFKLMQRLHSSRRLTSILATHNLSLAHRTDRVLHLQHGKLNEETAERAAWVAPVAGIESQGERGVTRV
jgi:lipoprotein-releasing system ATP-binding protein